MKNRLISTHICTHTHQDTTANTKHELDLVCLQKQVDTLDTIIKHFIYLKFSLVI